MVHIGADTVDLLILGVAVVSLVLTFLAYGAYVRAANRKLLFVVAAFALFFLKQVITVYSLNTGAIEHEDLELMGSGFDLAIVLLLVAPFLRRPAPAP